MKPRDVYDRLARMVGETDTQDKAGPLLGVLGDLLAEWKFQLARDDAKAAEKVAEAQIAVEAVVSKAKTDPASLPASFATPPPLALDPGRLALFFEFQGHEPGSTWSLLAASIRSIYTSTDGTNTTTSIYHNDERGGVQSATSTETASVLTARLNALLSGRS